MEDLKICLGTRDYYISPTRFNGQILIHLRMYMRNVKGELIPQRRGITLKMDEFNDMLKALPLVEKHVAKLQKEESDVEYTPTPGVYNNNGLYNNGFEAAGYGPTAGYVPDVEYLPNTPELYVPSTVNGVTDQAQAPSSRKRTKKT